MSSGAEELFSPSGSGNPLSQLQISSKRDAKREYESDCRSYVVILSGHSVRATLRPKKALLLRYLIIQCSIATPQTGHIEFAVLDAEKTRRRLILSPNFTRVKREMFHTQLPFSIDSPGWMNCCFDLHSLYAFCFPECAPYQFLEEIDLGPSLKVRKIFAMKQNPKDEVFVPKKFNFVSGVEHRTIVVDQQTYGGGGDSQSSLSSRETPLQPLPTNSSSPQPEQRPHSQKSIYAFGRSYKVGGKADNSSHVQESTEKTKPNTAPTRLSQQPKQQRQITSIKPKRAKSSYVVRNPPSVKSRLTSSPTNRSSVPSSTTKRTSSARSGINKRYDPSTYQNEVTTNTFFSPSESSYDASHYSSSPLSPKNNRTSTNSSQNIPKHNRASTNSSQNMTRVKSSTIHRISPRSNNVRESKSEKIFSAIQLLEQDQSLITRSIQNDSPKSEKFSHQPSVARHVNRSQQQKINRMDHSVEGEDSLSSTPPSGARNPPSLQEQVHSDHDSMFFSEEEEENINSDIFSPRVTPDHKTRASRYGAAYRSKRTLNLDTVQNEPIDLLVPPQRSESPRVGDDESDIDGGDSLDEGEFPVHQQDSSKKPTFVDNVELASQNSPHHTFSEQNSRTSLKSNFGKENKIPPDSQIKHSNNDHDSLKSNLNTKSTSQENTKNGAQDDEEIELLYDPVFKCYYNPVTNRYYQAK